jgi:hypothetical protein
VRSLDTAVTGVGAGDNVAFVWNFWWARHVLGGGSPEYFRTALLFAPFGTSLVLNTSTPLQAWMGATVLGGLPLVRAHNVVLLCGLAADGFTTYLLAYAFTRRVWPAAMAGTAFATSAYVSVHLLGHFNLVHAWVLPLAALAWVSLLAAPSAPRALAAGAAFAAAAYSDYYYLVYATLFAVAWWSVVSTNATLSWRPDRFRKTSRTLMAVACLALAAGIAIAMSSGLRFNLGPIHVSAMQARNPVSLAGLCLLAWVLLHTRVTLERSPHAAPVGSSVNAGASTRRKVSGLDLPARRRVVVHVVVAAAIGGALTLPLAAGALSMARSGDYVSQQYFWRSAPRGVDLATIVLGNPMHALSGAWTRAAYDRLGINVMEQAAWLGVVPALLLVGAIRFRATLPATARPWFWIAGLFAIWSLGPYLTIAGLDTGLLLPQSLARYVPIVSNARMPGRAFVVVQLAVAVLGAMAVSSWNWTAPRVAALTAFLVMEGLAAPYPLYRLPAADAVDRILRASGAGIVVELPTGTRDGFGEWGRFDQRALVHQTLHGQPLVGGAVSRVPPRVIAGYRNTPAIAALFELSAGTIAADALPSNLGASLAASGIRHVVVNTGEVPEALREPFRRRGLLFVVADGPRELYAVAR